MAEPYRRSVGGWLGYLGLRSLLLGLRLLPLALAAGLGGGLARLVFRLVPERRRRAREEMQRALGADFRTDYPEQNLAHFGIMAAEIAHLPTITRRAEQYLQLVDERYYETAAACGGVILLTGHIGNWEILGLGHARRYGPISALVKRLHNAWIDRWIVASRERLGVHSLVASGTVHEAVSLLKAGGTLAVLMDQNTMENEAVWVPFFGRTAATQAGVAMLAARSGATVIPAAGYRLRPGHFAIRYYPPVAIPGKEYPLRYRVYHGTVAFAAAVETLIRARPEQWLWLHKRWKNRPTDDTAPWRVGCDLE